MALPLMVGDRVLGALDVQSIRAAAFSQEGIAVLQLMADQVAVAIDNARKFSEEAGLLEATSPLYRVGRRLATAVTVDEIVQAITASVAETEADGCAVGRLDISPAGNADSATFLGSWDRQGESGFPVGVTFSDSSSPFPLRMVKTFWTIDDVAQESRMPEAPRQFLTRFRGRAFVNVPLRVGGQVTGFVTIYRATPGPFSPVSLRLYETLVDQAAVALERARLLEETQSRFARDRMVEQIASQVQRSLDFETILKTTVREVGRALGARATTIEVTGLGDNGDDLPLEGGAEGG
jgi:GAF domain-containing protein